MQNIFRKTAVAATALAALGLGAHQAQAQVVISQVYGGGGSTSTTPTPSYKYDFIELYNNGTTIVNLATAGYSLQYASATGLFSAGNTNALQGTIAPGDYYLVREGSPNGTITGADLTSYNDVGSLNLSATAGKVALANSTTPVTFTVPNTFSANTVDFVGYGTTATTYEGSGPAPAPSTTTSIARTLTSGKYVDTNSNSADFTTETPTPHTGAYVYVPPAAAPEPSSVVAMIVGMGVLGLLVARRRTRQSA